jgi:hypothetical protein
MARRTITALAFLIIAAGPAAAQGPAFGVLAGITSSKVAVSGDGATLTFDSRIGFSGGVSMQLPLSTMLDLEVDALYAQKGFKISAGDDSAELKLGYIEFPVMLRYAIGTASARPFLLAGGSLAFEAGCDVSGTSEGITAETSCEDLLEETQKSTEMNLVFGGGVAFDRLSITARYALGMTDIFDDDDTTVDAKNRAIFLLVGFAF